jgi:hypothetical protein
VLSIDSDRLHRDGPARQGLEHFSVLSRQGKKGALARDAQAS